MNYSSSQSPIVIVFFEIILAVYPNLCHNKYHCRRNYYSYSYDLNLNLEKQSYRSIHSFKTDKHIEPPIFRSIYSPNTDTEHIRSPEYSIIDTKYPEQGIMHM